MLHQPHQEALAFPYLRLPWKSTSSLHCSVILSPIVLFQLPETEQPRRRSIGFSSCGWRGTSHCKSVYDTLQHLCCHAGIPRLSTKSRSLPATTLTFITAGVGRRCSLCLDKHCWQQKRRLSRRLDYSAFDALDNAQELRWRLFGL